MTATHPRFRAALLVSLTAVVALCVVLLPSRSYAGPVPEVLQAVHTDALHTTYDGTSLRLSTRIGLGEYREADPANLIFNLEDKASARVELPDLPAFSFLGKPGDPVWIAPESQDPDLIWPGWDTETIAPGVLRGDAVDLTLLTATGPGNVEVFFNYDEFTGKAQRLFSATDPSLRTLHQPVGRHVHANWSFTAQGTYHLTFQATATTPTGTPLTSTPTTYTFVVGPYTPPTTPPTTPPPTKPTPTNTPTYSPTPPIATPTTPGHPTPTPTAPSRTTPAPTLGRTTPPIAPPRATPPPPPPATPSRSSSGGDEEYSTSDSPPKPTNSGPPPGNLPPCITTSTTNPSTTNPTAAGTTTNPQGSPNSPGATPPPATTTSPNPAKVTLDNGHADYAVRLENGALKSRVKDGTNPGAPIWRDPSAVTIKLTAASATHAPGGAFNFLGPAGSPLWQIPQTQKDGVIWLGWNTEELTKTQLSTPVDWRLTRVTGPGALAVFEFDSFGQPKIIFNSRDGLPDSYKIPLGTHAHGNWSFTKPGTYQATFTHTATLTTGKPSTTTSTLSFVVPTTSSNASNGAHPAAAHRKPAAGADRQHAAQVREASVVFAGSSPKRSAAESCKLASTGAEVGPAWIGAGATLLVIGAVTLVATRRRRDDA